MTVRGICLRYTIIIYVQESKAEVQTLNLSKFSLHPIRHSKMSVFEILKQASYITAFYQEGMERNRIIRLP